jgi:bis(5'-nucleosidyl)-tetraphosphatase
MKVKSKSSGAVVFFVEGNKVLYLLLRAYRNWDFPKGKTEDSESPLEAAGREVAEETGLTNLRFYDDFTETPPYGSGKVARFYIAESKTKEVTLPVSPELGRPEHHEYRWVPYEEARTLLNDRLKAVLDWAHEKVCALHGL